MQAEEDDDAFFTQAVEAADEAEAAYYRGHTSQSNVGEPDHMNEEEENVFLSQATDEVEAAYYRRKVDQGNTGDPSHSNRVVVED